MKNVLVSKKPMGKSTKAFHFIVNIIMLLCLVICLIPFVYMIALSFSSSKAIINNQVTFFPVGFNLNSYKQILNYPNFFHAYGNTIFYTVFGTLIAMFMTVCFAYPLSKPFLLGKKKIMKLVIFSMYFSGGMIPNYLILANLHLTSTRFAILLPFAINQFNLIILISFFKSIPKELEDAARIDGLNYIGTLVKIVLPLSKAALATIALYYAVFFWNDWFYSLIYLKSDQYPIMLFLRNIVNGSATTGDGAGAADKTVIGISIKSAVIIVSTLPIIIVYPFLQKYFVKGLTVGSVKE